MEDKALEKFFEVNKITPSKPFRHDCGPQCKLWRQPGTDIYVCRATYSVHFCGSSCNRGIASRGNEGLVCPLTGIVVGDIFPVIMRPGFLGKPGDINCVLASTVRRTGDVCRRDDSAIKRYVDQGLLQIFNSPARQQLQQKKQERIHRFIKRELRKGVSFTDISAMLMTKDMSYLSSYRTNPLLLRTLEDVGQQIVHHWSKFKLRPLRKVVYAFVGAVITLLGQGKEVDGITLYQVNHVLRKAQPEEADLGPLLGVSCRNITKMIKLIINNSLHTDGMPKPNFVFTTESKRQQRSTLMVEGKAKTTRQKNWKFQMQ